MKDSNQIPAEKTVAEDIAFRSKRAVETGRPLFLIVYYEHEAVKLAFLKSLQLAVKGVGLTTQTYDPAQRKEHGTRLLYPLLAAAASEKILALIAGLPRLPEGSDLDPTFLEYLNLHRDQIAREKLRFVLFLHTADANQFIEGAGDLWDFRHHTYWLEGKAQASTTSLRQSCNDDLGEIQVSDEVRAHVDKHVAHVRSLIEETKDIEDKAELHRDLSNWLTRRHLDMLGASVALEGLELIPHTDSKLRAELEHELGYALKKAGNLSDALTHYQRALDIYRRIGNRSGEVVTLNNISQVYAVWGQYEECLKKLEESLFISRDIGDRSDEALTLNNISQVYHAWGRYEEALKQFEQSLIIYREIGDKCGEAVTLNNISQIFHDRGEYELAFKMLEDSLTIYRVIGDKYGEAAILNNIATIYFVWGRREEALQKLEKSLAIRREIDDRQGIAVTLNNIAQIYQAWGRYEEALKKLEESLAIHREIGDRSREAVTCLNLAVEYERRGDVQSAVKLAQCAVKIEEETKHPELEKHRSYLRTLEEVP